MRVMSKGEHLGRGNLKGLTVGYELMQCDFAKHLSDGFFCINAIRKPKEWTSC